MKNKGGTRVGRFRGSPMKPRRGAQEEIDRVHREREGGRERTERGGEVYDISKRPLFLLALLRPLFAFPQEGGKRRTDSRPRNSGKDKKVKQKADYVTPTG